VRERVCVYRCVSCDLQAVLQRERETEREREKDKKRERTPALFTATIHNPLPTWFVPDHHKIVLEWLLSQGFESQKRLSLYANTKTKQKSIFVRFDTSPVDLLSQQGADYMGRRFIFENLET